MAVAKDVDVDVDKDVVTQQQQQQQQAHLHILPLHQQLQSVLWLRLCQNILLD